MSKVRDFYLWLCAQEYALKQSVKKHTYSPDQWHCICCPKEAKDE